MEQAAALGDKLIVGVNSDASVRSLNKGPERPINPEWARVRDWRLHQLGKLSNVEIFRGSTMSADDVIELGRPADPIIHHADVRRMLLT